MKQIGQRLREARERLGFSREQIFEKTRIPVSILEALEEGNDTGLPVPYLRAFIRTLAGALNLDAAALFSEYDLRRNEQKEKEREGSKADISGSLKRSKAFVPIWVGFILIGLAAVYIFYGAHLFKEPTLPESVSVSHGKGDTGSSLFPITLKVIAFNAVWIEIQKDSAEASDFFLERNDSLIVAAHHLLRISADDVNALLCILNEDTLRWKKEDIPDGFECMANNLGNVQWKPILKKTNTAGLKNGAGSKPTLLTGIIDERTLNESVPVFRLNRITYKPNLDWLHELESLEPSLNILVFFRTDDPISAQVVPQLLKVKEESILPDVFVTLIGLGSSAGDRAGLSKMYTIQSVPSIVLLSRGHELGRIVGKPQTPIEKKILEIAQSAKL